MTSDEPELPEGCISLSDGTLTLVDADVVAEFGGMTWWVWRRAHYRYARRSVRLDGKVYTFALHRVVVDALPGQQVDHINGNTLDNRRCNLRLVTMSQNQMNRRAIGGASALKGVTWVPLMGKWRAKIGGRGTMRHLGYFETQEAAGNAYDAAALQLYGEHARTNAMVSR